MSDIFISYKREDRARAKRIALKLEEHGFSVWWDRKIPPGRTFDEVIQEALDAARCVIVLWSEESVRSNWVKEEAEKGASRGVLVPILIDEVPIPLGFGRLQTASLVDWDGGSDHREFVALKRSIRAMLGRPEETAFIPQLRGSGIGPLKHPPQPPALRTKGAAAATARAAAAVPAAGAGRSKARVAVLVATILLAAGTVAAYVLRDRLIAPAGTIEVASLAAAPPAGVATELGVLETLIPGPASPPLEATATVPAAGDEPATERIAEETGDAATDAEPSGVGEGAGAADLEPAAPSETTTDADTDAGAGAATVADIDTVTEGEADPIAAADVDCVGTLSELRASELDGGVEREALRARYEALWQRCSRALAASDGAWVVRAIDRLATAPEPASKAAPARQAEASAVEADRADIGWAEIASADDFVTCRDVRRGAGVSSAPIGVGDTFAPGTVWVFARVRAPRRQEVVTVRWLGAGDTVVREHRVTVGRNLGDGYRIFAAKGYSQAGIYGVELYNQNGDKIASRPFTVM